MASIDVEKLLSPVSPEAPCGEDLAYDEAYLQLEQAAKGREAQQIGESVIEAEEPNWADILRQCLELLDRTRDLRVLMYLIVSVMRADGRGEMPHLPDLRDGLSVLKGWIDQYWDCLWPELDREDPEDEAMERLNVLESFATETMGDPVQFLPRLRRVPLNSSRQAGSFCLRDIRVANGVDPMPDGMDAAPDPALIEAAFRDTDSEQLREACLAAQEAAGLVREIEATLTERYGAGKVPDLAQAARYLDEMVGSMSPYVSGLQAGPGGAADEPGDAALAGAPAGAPLSGEIRSPNDVVSAIDKICTYYEQREPSSPVPLLLKRARRMVAMDYLEIVKDLTPDALQTISLICGIDRDELET